MSVFDGIDLQGLTLRRMQFHIVGPPPQRGQEFLLEELGAVQPGEFREFFLERFRAGRLGNEYVFAQQSPTLGRLRRLLRGDQDIGTVSVELARDFASHHNRNMSTGVFMLLDVAHGEDIFYALLKFDDQKVLQFRSQGARTILELLQKTFVEDDRAMQKIAIARMKLRGEVSLIVRERSSLRDGTEYFRAFLQATRRWDIAELTKRVEQVVTDSKESLSGIVPHDQLMGAVSRAREFMLAETGLDEQSTPRFIARVFGPDPNGVIDEVVSQQMRRHRLEGESFEFDRSVVNRPRTRRIRTQENITITFSPEQAANVTVDQNGHRIVIRTQGITEHDDEPV